MSGLRPAHRAAGGPDTPAYAAPIRVADPAGLPPAYIEVAQLDMFRDEDLAYALRLGQAGVPSSSTFTPAPRTNSTSSPSTPPPPGAPSPTAFFREAVHLPERTKLQIGSVAHAWVRRSRM
ncbi:MAG: alpha/beta hydrolase fold domain-containing protein [Streptosporangiaceae bacterium]